MRLRRFFRESNNDIFALREFRNLIQRRVPLTAAVKSRLPALLCALALLLCALATYPVAEIGMADDWSYVRSAQVLEKTGHIVYNGWATAMLGWQLYLGALFVRLFGPSFTAIRASTLLVALATAFLVQRTLIRAGIHSRNATIGTLALVLSPLFLPLAVSFMSDIGGLFCIVLCTYACLRAMQAEGDDSVLAWLAFAAVSNALGGTIRQIAWLGVLVIFPSTVWLLRRCPRVVFTGVLLYLASGAFIVASLRWFAHQPYAITEPLVPAHLGRENLERVPAQILSIFLDSSMFLLPLLLAFLPAIPLRNKRAVDFLVVGGVLCLVAGLILSLRYPHDFAVLIAPYGGNYVAADGFVDGPPIQGSRPILFNMALRLLVTITVPLVLLGFLAFLISNRRSSAQPSVHLSIAKQVPMNRLLVLLVPFVLAYFALLADRCLVWDLFDRYDLPLLFIAILLLVRLYQDSVKPNLPVITIVLVVLFAALGVAGTHDAYSLYRAKAAAVAELRAAGVSDIAIDGGFESNAMTQIDRTGYINEPRIRVPAAVYVQWPSPFPSDCQPDQWDRTPVILPGYTLSFDPAACGGLSRFPPVTYSNWLGKRTVAIYIVNTIKPTEPPR